MASPHSDRPRVPPPPALAPYHVPEGVDGSHAIRTVAELTRFRWTGLAGIAGGVLLVIATVVDFLTAGEDPGAVNVEAPWLAVAAHTLLIFASFGFAGLLGDLTRPAAHLGLALAVVGNVFIAGLMMIQVVEAGGALTMPVEDLVDELPSLLVIATVGYVGFVVGYLVLAYSLIRAQVTAIYAPAAIVIGCLLLIGGPILDVIFVSGMVVFAAGAVWLGKLVYDPGTVPAMPIDGPAE